MITWLKQNKFKAHLLTFSLMVISSIGMIFAASGVGTGLIWGLLAIFALANMMAMFIK